NLHATRAVAQELEHAGVDALWCLGDVVGYGANPREVLEWTRESVDVVVKRNHDEAVATGDVEGFNPIAAAAARYHAQVLSPTDRTVLHDLHLDSKQDIGKESQAALLVHASPDDPLREYVYPTSARRDL